MSEEQPQQPTQEQIREARHAGFNDSISHMAEDKRNQLSQSFTAQDARREKNISGFYQNIAGES